MEELDPGLAGHRTDLAWTRSAISFAALGLVLVKIRPVVGAPVLIFSAVIWSLGRFARTPERAGGAGRRVLLVTVAVTLLALTALVLTLVGHDSPGLRL
jgi:uncharacterized membrane protein YidH (DUF202 family)